MLVKASTLNQHLHKFRSRDIYIFVLFVNPQTPISFMSSKTLLQFKSYTFIIFLQT